MEYIIIDIPDINDSISRIMLGNMYCQIRFTYNDTKDYWSFGLYDEQENPVAIGIKIVPQMVLNLFFGINEMPKGAFGVITNLKRLGRNDFKDGKAKFVFVPLETENS